MDDVILSPFQHISVISGRWAGDNEKLFALKPCLEVRRFRLKLA